MFSLTVTNIWLCRHKKSEFVCDSLTADTIIPLKLQNSFLYSRIHHKLSFVTFLQLLGFIDSWDEMVSAFSTIFSMHVCVPFLKCQLSAIATGWIDRQQNHGDVICVQNRKKTPPSQYHKWAHHSIGVIRPYHTYCNIDYLSHSY